MSDSGIKLAQPYDWRISLRKAAGELGRDILLAAIVAAGAWLSDPTHTAALAQSAGPYAFVVTALAIAGGRFLTNYRKNRDR